MTVRHLLAAEGEPFVAKTGVQEREDGWRISLAIAIVPAVIFTLGSLFCPDTPASTLYQDPSATEKARKVRACHTAPLLACTTECKGQHAHPGRGLSCCSSGV
jgi:hypothetical protein